MENAFLLLIKTTQRHFLFSKNYFVTLTVSPELSYVDPESNSHLSLPSLIQLASLVLKGLVFIGP